MKKGLLLLQTGQSQDYVSGSLREKGAEPEASSPLERSDWTGRFYLLISGLTLPFMQFSFFFLRDFTNRCHDRKRTPDSGRTAMRRRHTKTGKRLKKGTVSMWKCRKFHAAKKCKYWRRSGLKGSFYFVHEQVAKVFWSRIWQRLICILHTEHYFSKMK